MAEWISSVVSLVNMGNVFMVLTLGIVIFFCWFVHFIINKLSESIDKMAKCFDNVAQSIERLILSQNYLEKNFEHIDKKVDSIKEIIQNCRKNK